MLPFSETAVAPLTKGQVSYKRKSHCKVSCLKPYAQFSLDAIGTGHIQVLLWAGICLLASSIQFNQYNSTNLFQLFNFIYLFMSSAHFLCSRHSTEKGTFYALWLPLYYPWKILKYSVFNSKQLSLGSNCTNVCVMLFVGSFLLPLPLIPSQGTPFLGINLIFPSPLKHRALHHPQPYYKLHKNARAECAHTQTHRHAHTHALTRNWFYFLCREGCTLLLFVLETHIFVLKT